MFKRLLLSVSFVLIGSGAAFAAGAHDGMQCTGCHNIHYSKGSILFQVAPNNKAMPQGAEATSNTRSQFCLGCHAQPEKGGMGILPISAHTSHPFGRKVNPKVANVPAALLRDGKMDCVSCHDPHPSNPNYKYLRVDTNGGQEMARFCGTCHASKVGGNLNRASLKIFDSMDERTGPTNKPLSELEVGGGGTGRPIVKK